MLRESNESNKRVTAMLDNLIIELGKDLEMTPFIQQTEDKHYHIPFSDNIEVEAIEKERSLLLKGNIGPKPQKNIDSFLLKALEANLFGLGTRGASIGLSEDEKLLTLTAELEYNRSYKTFKEKLEDFVTVLDFWRKEIVNHQ
jgi:Tir chaperone protein (CesT) family